MHSFGRRIKFAFDFRQKSFVWCDADVAVWLGVWCDSKKIFQNCISETFGLNMRKNARFWCLISRYAITFDWLIMKEWKKKHTYMKRKHQMWSVSFLYMNLFVPNASDFYLEHDAVGRLIQYAIWLSCHFCMPFAFVDKS